MNKTAILLSIFILAASIPGAGDTIVIPEKFDTQKIGNRALCLEDSTGTLTVKDVLQNGSFTINKRDNINYKYTASAIWVKWVFENRSGEEKLLEIPHPSIDSIHFYRIVKGNVVFKKTDMGDKTPFNTRLIDNRNFIFPVSPGPEPVTCLFRLKSTSYINFIPVLWSHKSFRTKDIVELAVTLAYVLFMFFMAVYSFILYLPLRDREHLFQIFLILVYAIHTVSCKGTGFQFFWPDSPRWASASPGSLLLVTGIIFVVFSIFYLDLKRTSRALYIFAITSIFILTTVLANHWFFQVPIINIIGWYTFAITLGTLSVYSLVKAVKGSKPALYYFLSWISIFITNIIGILYLNNLFPFPVINMWSIEIGSIFQIILLSIGISNKLHSIKQELVLLKDRAKERNHSDDEFNKKISTSIEKELNSTISFIENNYHTMISREELAVSIGLNTDYFSRAFKIYTGKKVNDYINELRVIEAARKISETDETIIAIAYSVGFESLRTFNRAFQKFMNVTPTDYRGNQEACN